MEAITWVIPDLNGEIIEWKKSGQRSRLVGKVGSGKCNTERKKKDDERKEGEAVAKINCMRCMTNTEKRSKKTKAKEARELKTAPQL